MKRINIFILAVLVLIAAACTVEETYVEPVTQTEDETATLCYEAGVITVKFSEEMAAMIGEDLSEGNIETRSSELNSLFSAYGVTSVKRVFMDDERWLERQHREGLHLWYDVTFDPEVATPTRAAGDFDDLPGIELAEPCPKVEPTGYYNDYYYDSQWHLTGNYDINVEPVWEKYTKGSSDVIVAVVDGGIDVSHPDLSANVIPGGSGGSRNFIYGNYTITPHGHGSHVAGIISAVSNNGTGVAGIAGGDYAAGIAGTKLLSCQVFDDSYSAASSNFAVAMQYGADNGALISQNSWDYTYGSEAAAKEATTPESMITAIDYFIKYAGCDNDGEQLPDSKMKGGVVIFAAGNNGWSIGKPCDYEPVIAVGATDSNGEKASYSNYGDWVDICAPGTNVLSTYYQDGSNYAYLTGTSMACPMVSGVAALVIAYYGGPGFTNDNLTDCLILGADSDKVTAENIGPYLDALGAIEYGVQTPPNDIDSYSVSVSGNTLFFTWNVPAGDETGTVPADGMLLCASLNRSSIDGLAPRKIPSDVTTKSVSTVDNEVGEKVTASLTLDDFNTTYYVTCVPYNGVGQYANVAATKIVSTGSNNPPKITASDDISDIRVRAGRSVSVTFDITEPDAHDFTVKHETSSIAETWSSDSDSSYELTISGMASSPDGTGVPAGSYTTSLTATDSYGASSTATINYTILENEAPTVAGTLENLLVFAGNTKSVDIAGCFSDPDEDELEYTIENSSSSTVGTAVEYDGNGGVTLRLTAMKSGTATITVVASDPLGLSCSLSFIVVARSEGENVIAYPNPCTTVLNIGTDTTADTATAITISSSTGSVVYNDTVNASAFDPAVIDVKGFAPGTYSVKVKYGTTEVTKKVVKN